MKIFEGGNVIIDGQRADKVDLKEVSRSTLTHAVRNLLLKLNAISRNTFNKPIWEREDLLNGMAFNGSSETLFRPDITDQEYVAVKRKVGDIDVTVPSNMKEQIDLLLKSYKGRRITPDAEFVGHNKEHNESTGHQINALFILYGLYDLEPKRKLYIQIDFEFVDYVDDAPSAFAKFSHNSHWDDMQAGIKGVMHKLLLRSLVGGASMLTANDAVVLTKAATIDKPRISTPFLKKGSSLYKFGVDRGLRAALEPVIDPKTGQQLKQDGKPVYRELSTEVSKYTQDILEIAGHIFGKEFDPADLQLMYSFVGTLSLMKKYLNQSQIQSTAHKFAQTLWGPGSQHVNQTIDEDSEVKLAGWTRLYATFPFVDEASAKEMYETYYSGFEERQSAMLARKGITEDDVVGVDPKTIRKELTTHLNGSEPEFVLVMGGAGVGKNHYIRNDPTLKKYTLIDIDQMKDSSSVPLFDMKQALKDAIEAGKNIVHPTIGSAVAGNINKLNFARKNGYKTTVIFLDGSIEQGIAHVKSRVSKGGHSVPDEKVKITYEKAAANYPAIAAAASNTIRIKLS